MSCTILSVGDTEISACPWKAQSLEGGHRLENQRFITLCDNCCNLQKGYEKLKWTEKKCNKDLTALNIRFCF